MRQISLFCACAILLGALAVAAEPLDISSGSALARALRSAPPEESSDISGTLIIKSNGQIRMVPVMCRVTLEGATWRTDYQTSSVSNTPAEHLVVVHSTNGPSEYLFARAAAPGQPAPKPAPIQVGDTGVPLAGSDFSFADLGLQFLHWPQQNRLRDQTRLGQACYVLESSNPEGGNIVKIKSFIDQQTGGILEAEADDAQGRPVKVFSLHGSSFKKVNGHWRLQKMEISDHRTHSKTELRFNVDSDNK